MIWLCKHFQIVFDFIRTYASIINDHSQICFFLSCHTILLIKNYLLFSWIINLVYLFVRACEKDLQLVFFLKKLAIFVSIFLVYFEIWIHLVGILELRKSPDAFHTRTIILNCSFYILGWNVTAYIVLRIDFKIVNRL